MKVFVSFWWIHFYKLVKDCSFSTRIHPKLFVIFFLWQMPTFQWSHNYLKFFSFFIVWRTTWTDNSTNTKHESSSGMMAYTHGTSQPSLPQDVRSIFDSFLSITRNARCSSVHGLIRALSWIWSWQGMILTWVFIKKVHNFGWSEHKLLEIA